MSDMIKEKQNTEEVKYTVNQRRAITEPGNIIVSAGAGSGKTAVMIARIADKLINGGATLDEMLIVTFTRSAAADMRYKLAEKLAKLRKDGMYASVAERAIESMPGSNIGTLHGFCQKLIRKYFYAAGVDPSAALCDEGEAAAIEWAAVSSAVENAINKNDVDFAVMYDMLATRRSDDGLKRAVRTILDFALSTHDPEGFLSNVKPDDTYRAELNAMLERRYAELVKRIFALKADIAAACMIKYSALIDELACYIAGDIDKLTRSPNAPKDETAFLHTEFCALKDACKKYRNDRSEADTAIKNDNERYAKALLSVARDAFLSYKERKERLGVIDYSDLEHGAYRVLKDETCREEIASGIKYVFIDEFQDVNPLQSEIAERLRASVKETFVVGDVKQSIYGFRRCSPEHFINAINSGKYTHIPLTDNFRSSAPVIDFVNKVFDGVMTEDFGGVNYSDADQRLVFGNKSMTGGSAEYVLIPSETGGEESDSISDDRGGIKDSEQGYSVVKDSMAVRRDPEAVFVARKICEILAGSNAPEMGKIAVLTRTQGAFTTALMRELDERNIKYGLDKKRAAKAFPEIIALTDILRCVDNRMDDVALFTALRSPMGGFSDGELAEIAARGENILRTGNAEKSAGGKAYALWQKLCAYDGELDERIRKFIALRDRFSEYAKDHDCAETLGEITSAIDFFQYIYEQNGSAQAVQALIDFAAEKDCDIHTFLEYYDNTEFGIDASGGGDAVTLITEHSSKGLEYDYCIVADTSHRFNERDRYGKVIVSERGVFVKVPDRDGGTLEKTAPYMVESLRMPGISRAENLRLFYVALTRAKKNLLVCGKQNKSALKENVEDGLCQTEFMRNILPSIDNGVELPSGAACRTRPSAESSAAIAAAVSEKISKAERYNTDRIARTSLGVDKIAPIKTCVTAVAHEFEDGDYTATAPVLTKEYAASDDARLRGTAYHRAMELIDFSAPDLAAVEHKCERFDLVDRDAVLNAAKTMARLVSGAAFVAKERYFVVDLPLGDVYGTGGDGVLVQGVIDLLIAYPDGSATIVDYKTGDPRFFDYSSYGKQLELYIKAVERSINYKVKHAYLYSFTADKLIEYPNFAVDK